MVWRINKDSYSRGMSEGITAGPSGWSFSPPFLIYLSKSGPCQEASHIPDLRAALPAPPRSALLLRPRTHARSAFRCRQLPAVLLQSPLCRCLSLPSEFGLLTITWALASQNGSLAPCWSQRQPSTPCRIKPATAQTICNRLSVISPSNEKN